MIQTRTDLYEFIEADLRYYHEKKNTIPKKIYSWFVLDNVQMVKRFIVCLRKCEYYLNNSVRITQDKTKLFFDIMYVFQKRKLNKLSIKLGLEIYENSFEKGLEIYHTGGTVVNPNARIGRSCKLHGNNCIGNNGMSGGEGPRIGNNVQFGVGAKVLGDIEIADNIKIVAGAIVVNSFSEPGIVLAGIPARKKEQK